MVLNWRKIYHMCNPLSTGVCEWLKSDFAEKHDLSVVKKGKG